MKGESLDESGELVEKWRGIYQESAISPILSNIYLMDFDHKMAAQPTAFFRYSDDIFILAEDREKLQAVFQGTKAACIYYRIYGSGICGEGKDGLSERTDG